MVVVDWKSRAFPHRMSREITRLVKDRVVAVLFPRQVQEALGRPVGMGRTD